MTQRVAAPAFANAARPPRYEPLFELDQSGCARSHLAIDHGEGSVHDLPGPRSTFLPERDRLVVVHVVPATLTREPEFVPLFAARASALIGVSHANLVRTLDFVAEGERCQWVSEFIQGHTLASLLAKKRGNEPALTLRQHVTILCEVLRGLDHVHRRVDADGLPSPIVHGHLSPSSVLVSYEGEVKLTDAVLRADEVTAGRFEGEAERLAYQAPECWQGGPRDPRSDIFAVGALLWEALCGRSWPPGANRAETGEMSLRASEPEFDGTRAGVSPTLIAITRRALAMQPSERYQSAREFLLALEAQMPLVPANRDRGSLFAFMCSHFYAEHEALQRLLASRAPGVPGAASEPEENPSADAIDTSEFAAALPPNDVGGSAFQRRLVRGVLGVAFAAGAVLAFFVVRPERHAPKVQETIVQRLRPPPPSAAAGPSRATPSAVPVPSPGPAPNTGAPSAPTAPSAASASGALPAGPAPSPVFANPSPELPEPTTRAREPAPARVVTPAAR